MYKFILISISLFLFHTGCKTPTGQVNPTENRTMNKLATEKSPYLLQHRYNPVNWYPWGDEALQKAKSEGKMMIISVGYSACHWCHVMEHESFEDSTVAKLMNEHFVSVKVDREERPDIDDVYMTACHLVSRRSCGWPLNAITLPDGKPFFAGTYFPKKDWLNLLNTIVAKYEKDRKSLEDAAASITNGIQSSDEIVYYDRDENFNRKEIDEIAKSFISGIDMKMGGRKASQQRPTKFPMPNNYEFLLNYHQLTGNIDALRAVEITLDRMFEGGIYDHLGGGFARYSTDPNWKVPHFEKMLYDNGQIVSLYAHAYQKTKKPEYKKVVYETLDFIERELTNPKGGFYSSLDADSEGVEGKFYVWTKAEIQDVLGNVAPLFSDYYSVTEHGNWEESNILFISKPPSKVASKNGLTPEQLEAKISAAKIKLMKARDKRIRPGLDDKVLTSWNGLMLKGYVDAYRVFDEPKFLEAAIKNANFLLKNAKKTDGSLYRNYKDGKSGINGFLDDYATLADALIALYQATFDQRWLDEAKGLVDYSLSNFYDDKTKMFFYTSNQDEPLIARKKELSDNVIPASNSMMARNLFHLGVYLYNDDYRERSIKMLNSIVDKLENIRQPSFYSNWCQLYNSFVWEPFEVAIVGQQHSAFRKEMDQNYLPNVLMLGGKDEGSMKLLKNKLVEGQTTVYVCQNKSCKLPVTEVNKAIPLIKYKQ